MLSRLGITLVCSFALLTPILATSAQDKGGDKDKKEERPSQDAVLANNTVTKLNQAFGKDEKQTLDVYAPKGARNAPVVIFVHRGEWTKGDKAEVSFKPKFLNENGIVFVSTNYRLSPAVMHPAHVSDVAAAVRWVKDHANEIGAAPDKIVLMGHSAGCHLVTLTALDPRYLAKVKLTPKDVRGVVAWSGGMYDLVDQAKREGFYTKYIRQAFGDSEAAWRDASPAAHVGDGPMPPFLFAYIERKTDDKEKRVEPSQYLASLIRKAKGAADVHLLADRTHFSANHLVGAPGDTTGKLLLDFVRRVTK
ncbi:MAG: alpha/beta hydrolase [Planctomycetes bacterium]|nr:alpha/beta hydrolase [Planctomycetota bacterium]